jgi:hypothetical protein
MINCELVARDANWPGSGGSCMRRRQTAAIVLALSTMLCASVFAEDVGEGAKEFFCLNEYSPETTAGHYQQVLADVLWSLDDGLPGSKENKIIKIGVFFQNGTANQRNEVKQYAQEWITKSGAAIEWVFSDSIDSQIRITFERKGSWSKVGTDALDVKNKEEPTMSLAIKNMSLENRRQTILHEFGHVLEMKHEHLHFQSGLKFDEKQIFKDLKDNPFCADEHDKYLGDVKCMQRIQLQITKPLPESYACVDAPKYDKKSIMMYSLPSNWTKPPGGTTASTVLSELDWKCIRGYYAKLTPPPQIADASSKPPYCEVTGSRVFIRSSPKRLPNVNEIGDFTKGTDIYVTYLPKNNSWGRVRSYCSVRTGRWRPLVEPGYGYISLRYLRCSDMPPQCGDF